MPWLPQTKMERRPGTKGRVTFIVDSSASMIVHQDTVDAEFKALRKSMPGARLFVYGEEAFEIKMNQFGENWVQWRVGNGTKHLYGWRLIKDLDQGDTFFLSDAQSHLEERDAVLRMVERMSGNVHVFYCASEYNPRECERFMREIARVGNGMFFDVSYVAPRRFRKAVETALGRDPDASWTKEATMPKQQLPDMFLDNPDEFEFVKPPDVDVNLKQLIRLHTGTEFQEIRHAPVWHDQVGNAYQQRVEIGSASVEVQEPQRVIRKGFLRRGIGWLTSDPEEAPAIAGPQQGSYRGQIVEASYEPVHAPQPGNRALAGPPASAGYYLPPQTSPALAPPRRATFTPQLTDQSQAVPMGNAATAPVRAKFTR